MESTHIRAAVILILLVGAALRTVQYGSTVSMSPDEVALALNITDRSWNELLFQPLMYDQVAPPGFLVLQRVSVAIGGDNEAAHRFFPFLFSLVSLVLFCRLSRHYLTPLTMLAALIVFATSPSLILYAGVAKQYSGDIMVTLLLLLMALRYGEGSITLPGSVVIGVAGGMALLLSQPAVLVAFGLGLFFLIEGKRLGKPTGHLVAICAGWFAGAAITTYTSWITFSPSTSEFMDFVWKRGFMPLPWLGLEELFWIPVRLLESVSFFVAHIASPRSLPAVVLFGVYGFLFLVGVPYLAKRDVRSAALLAVPVVMAIMAAALRLLPLMGRVSLFVGPSLLIGCLAGFDRIRGWLPSRHGFLPNAGALGLAALPALFLLVRDPPPRILSGTRPVLQAVKDHWRPGDELAAAKGQWAWVEAEYYGRRLGLENWARVGSWEGKSTVEDYLRGYLRSIDEFRGAPRTWFYLEDTVPCVEETMHGYLTTIGKRLYSARYRINAANQVSAHLYDLSDPALLSQADADSYRLPDCMR